MKKFCMVLLLPVMLFMATNVMAQVDEDSLYATTLIKKGAEVPNFEMTTIDGKTFNLSSLKGKYVVLDFWASWCPDCRKDAPNMVRLYNQFHQMGVEFVGISFDTDVKAWKAGVDMCEIPFMQVSELKKFRETDISKTYGVNWIPSMYLIDTEGKVVISTVVSAKLEKALNELFATSLAR